MKISKSLLLQQQYLDSWEEFKLAKESKNYPTWDYIVITASNDFQSQGYLHQIDSRKSFLPSRSKFLVVPDEGGKRVGSGGATLTVLKKIYELEQKFHHLRILVIHSGGDSKRTPQYSALGKLFSPVPRVLPDGRSSTLFDEIIIAMSGVAPRIKEGMLLLSGDALLLFNPLKINFFLNEAGCITFKERPEVGQRHGVFVSGETGFVKKCLQKKSVEVLKKEAVDENGYVDIDTGAIIFSSPILDSLYALIDNEDKYFNVVNSKVRLSLYIDFMYPLGEEATLENFLKEKPEGEMCEELIEVRKKVWDILRKFKLKQIKMYPAKFIHFGSTPEIMNLMNNDINDYKEIGWSPIVNSCSNGTSSYNSIISNNTEINKNVYIECSYIKDNVKIGKNVYLSFVEINENMVIPDDIIMHGLKQNNGKIVCRILGINDNPKEEKLFGKDISSLPFGLKGNLWNAVLYPEYDTMKEAVLSALNIYNIAHNNNGKLDEWKKGNKKSLSSGFNDADSYSLIEWNNKMINLVKCGKVEKYVEENKSIDKIKCEFDSNTLNEEQKLWLEEKIKKSNFEKRIRLLYYFGEILHDENYINKCFEEIKNTIINESLNSIKYNDTCKIVKDKFEIYLPLRINFSGGWTDTPPYCLENGGSVLNASISLKGLNPIHISIEKIKEKKINFLAKDINESGEFDNINQIQNIKDNKDNENESLSLIQNCLILGGIIPKEGGNLTEILERFGSGFSIQWEVISTPRGSGLGTASILIGGILKSLFEFFGIEYNDNIICNKVLEIEQIMGTGGGWQDTIGGLYQGFKVINTEKGVYQNLNIKKINLNKENIEELEKRFLLINTGERRLSRTLLKQVVGRYIGNIEENVKNLNESKNIVNKMIEALEKGSIDDFALLLNEQWNCSLKIIPETTNNLINGIFKQLDEYIDGKMICGPGGGGFLQVILKKGITSDIIKEKLKEMFGDSEICIYESKFN